ncbi:MAG: hypothetical protein U0804_11610 [Gemmataceae bacterium]
MAKGDKKADDKAAARPAEFKLRADKKPTKRQEASVHVINAAKGIVCATERRGHPTPQGRSPLDLVLDAPGGTIPLWGPDTTLRWRFREESFDYFADPEKAMEAVRKMCSKALRKWGAALPVAFTYDDGLWDFEIVMSGSNNCNNMGCTLASAFFPGSGQNKIMLYPRLFEEGPDEIVETLCHEFGHTFGLRHFFALTSEQSWPAKIFGRHDQVSIMNYGANSTLTDADKEDLEELYRMAWSGELTHVNGTPIRFVSPYSAGGSSAVAPAAVGGPAPVANPVFAPAARAGGAAMAVVPAATGRVQSRKPYLASED